MTLQSLLDAIEFLEKIYVGKGSEERLIATITSLKKEVEKRKAPK